MIIHKFKFFYDSRLVAKCWLAFIAFSGIQSAVAITIANYDSTINNRFVAGFNTSSPVLNSDPMFVGAGYDWSGIGWNASPGDSARVQGFTMLSPVNAFSAWHYSLTQNEPSDNSRVHAEFMSSTGTTVTSTLSFGRSVSIPGFQSPGLNQDVRITNLLRPLAENEGVHVLRILDISSGNYVGQPALLVGSVIPGVTNFSDGQLVATGKISSMASWYVKSNTHSENPDVSFVEWESGDSGSPLLITYKGQLTIAGGVGGPSGIGNSLLTNVSSGYNPVPGVNAVLAMDGYAEKWTIYDAPTDTLNTANRWRGNSGSGAFGAAGNWTSGTVPSSLPVVFDAAAANGQTAIVLGGDRNLRGILFVSGGASGFTFASGNTLTVGSTGIRNESTFAQTFNGNISLGRR